MSSFIQDVLLKLYLKLLPKPLDAETNAVITDKSRCCVYAETQRDPPQVLTSKPVYQVGETLEANCTSSPAQPVAGITWLVNGKAVSTVHDETGFFFSPLCLLPQMWLTFCSATKGKNLFLLHVLAVLSIGNPSRWNYTIRARIVVVPFTFFGISTDCT